MGGDLYCFTIIVQRIIAIFPFNIHLRVVGNLKHAPCLPIAETPNTGGVSNKSFFNFLNDFDEIAKNNSDRIRF